MKTILSLGILAGVLSAPSIWALQVTSTGGGGYGIYQTGEGGEFTLQTSGDFNWVLNYYNSKAKNVGGSVNTFQTFCVEMNEYIYPWATCDVQISDRTQFTGTELTKGAAWLYYEFATGNLADYDYAGRSKAGDLQNAIWWLMGQQSLPAGNIYVIDALSRFGFAGAFSANNGTYDVGVLNMWAPGGVGQHGYERQDQLVLTSVPDGGTTLALLGLGFGGVCCVSRRKLAPVRR